MNLSEETLDSLIGRSLVEWNLGDGGMHFTLDDGRVMVLSGAFVIAVYSDCHVVH